MIKHISAKGFQSWETLEFPIVEGATLIDGFNYDDNTPEGAGKSAVPNALCWGCFGRIPKQDVKIDDIIKEGFTFCEVRVYLTHPTIDYIFRTRGPNKLGMVDLNGKTIQGKDSRETQKLIDGIIGISYDTFCQTTYFAQGFSKKFVTATQEERGKILSEIQDLGVFDRGRKEVINLLKIDEKKIVGIVHDLETTKLRLLNSEQAIERQKQFTKQQRAELEVRTQTAIRQRQDKLNSQIDINTQLKNLGPLAVTQNTESLDLDLKRLEEVRGDNQAEIAKVHGLRANIIDNIRVRKTIKDDLLATANRITRVNNQLLELDSFIKNPTKVCNQCGTSLGDQDTSHAEAQVVELQAEHTKECTYVKSQEARLLELPEVEDSILRTKLMELQSKADKIADAICQITKTKQTVIDAVSKMSALKQVLIHIGTDIEALDLQVKTLEATVITESTQITEFQEEIAQLEAARTTLESLLCTTKLRMRRLELLKNGFREVKSYTFNSVLNELSRRVQQYLAELFEVSMDLRFTNSNMKIGMELKINGVSRGFGLFSGGQQKRIQLAVDLALSDVVSQRTGTNLSLLILDEPFQHLSESSMLKCVGLLERLNRPIILIEHNSAAKTVVDNTFLIEFRGGTSTQLTEDLCH